VQSLCALHILFFILSFFFVYQLEDARQREHDLLGKLAKLGKELKALKAERQSEQPDSTPAVSSQFFHFNINKI
jgi:hypothetical protein